MNGWPLLGIVLVLYAVMVFFIAIKKPDKMWNMKKIEGFRKVLGENGTVIFFIIWGAAAAVLGVWLMMK